MKRFIIKIFFFFLIIFISCSYAYNSCDVKYDNEIYHCKLYYLHADKTLSCTTKNNKTIYFTGSYLMYNMKTYNRTQHIKLYGELK